MPQTWGIVLAGGQSSRMGTDKALLSVNGQTLIDHSLSVLTRTHVDSVAVSGDRVGAMHDQYPAIGPIGGIVSVLKSLDVAIGDTVMFTAVDTPLITEQMFKQLQYAAYITQCSRYFEQQFLPVCVVINRTVLDFVTQFDGEPISIKRFLSKIGAKSVPFRDSSRFLNLNHPCEWQKYHAACSVA